MSGDIMCRPVCRKRRRGGPMPDLCPPLIGQTAKSNVNHTYFFVPVYTALETQCLSLPPCAPNNWSDGNWSKWVDRDGRTLFKTIRWNTSAWQCPLEGRCNVSRIEEAMCQSKDWCTDSNWPCRTGDKLWPFRIHWITLHPSASSSLVIHSNL